MAKRLFLGCVTAVAMLCAACEGDIRVRSEEEEGFVRGVESADLFSRQRATLRLAADPVVVVGTSDTLPLTGVRTAVFFGNGIAITRTFSTGESPLRDSELLIVDAAGEFRSRQGGRGSGPEKYVYLGGAVRHGDGLVTWDANNGRVTLLDAEGEYVRETRIAMYPWLSPEIVGAFGSSALVEYHESGFRGDGPASPQEVRRTAHYEVVSLLDGAMQIRVDLPGEELWATREQSESGGMAHGGLPVIFGRRAVAAVVGARAYVATTDSLTLDGYDEGGRREVISLMPHLRVSTQERWVQIARDTAQAYWEARASGEGAATRTHSVDFNRRLLTDLPARATLPNFSDIKGATDGRLWVRGYSDPTQDHDVWVAFDEAWTPHERVAVPKHLRVLDFSVDRVLVLKRDEFGEGVVEVYTFEPEPE